MQILISGSRDWEDVHSIYLVLAGAQKLAEALEEPLLVVHGAAHGADSIAEAMSQLLRIPTKPMPANWKEHGKSAGPKRNQQMLDENVITVTYAFRLPGISRGTDDMISKSKAAGIPTYVIGKA